MISRSGIRMAFAMAVLVGGCGGGGQTRDAPIGGDFDAVTADGALADAPAPGTVIVETRRLCCTPGAEDGPAAGIEVVLVEADGSARDPVATDTDGFARFEDVAPGASVTATYPFGDGGAEIETVVGVAPGDHLVMGSRIDPPNAGTPGTMTVAFPPIAGAHEVRAIHRCGSNSVPGAAPSVTVLMLAHCQRDDGEIWLVAIDDSFRLIGTARIAGAYTPDTEVAVTAWTPPRTVTASVAGLPADADEIWSLGLESVVAPWLQFFVLGEGPPSSIELIVPADNDRFFGHLSVYRDGGDRGIQRHVFAAPGDSEAFDLTPPSLPWVAQTSVDFATGQVSWSLDGTGDYDGTVLQLQYDRDIDGTPIYSMWRVMVPPGTTSWSWAALRTALGDAIPRSTDVARDFLMELQQFPDVDGYDELRQVPMWIYGCAFCAVFEGTTPGPVALSVEPNVPFDSAATTAAPAHD